eukprot:scaffold38902_cov33-Attheya_sp.AAC.1
MGSIDTPHSCGSNAGRFMATGDVALELSPLSGPAWHGEMEFDLFFLVQRGMDRWNKIMQSIINIMEDKSMLIENVRFDLF